MKKHLLALMSLCLLATTGAWALEAGTYYLWNVGAARYLHLGGTDGYTSCFYPYGAPLKLEASGSGWKIGNTTYDSGSYLNASGVGKSSAAVFTITETAEGSGLYTIQSTKGYWGYNSALESTLQSGTTVDVTLTDDGSDNVHWQLMTRDELTARMDAATPENPVDATHLISCPGFNRHEVGIKTDWNYSNVVVASLYYNPNQAVWHTNPQAGGELSDMSQKLTGLKAGRYVLTCQGFYRAGSNTVAYNAYSAGTHALNARLYAGQASCPLLPIYADGQSTSAIYDAGKATNSSWDWTNSTQKGGLWYPYYSDGNTYPSSSACVAFDNGLYEAREGYNTVDFYVDEGQEVTIGVRTVASVGYDWLAVDNFRLTYLGKADQQEFVLPNLTMGALNAVCLPFDVKEEDFGPLYQVGAVRDGVAQLMPVSQLSAGVPCVILAEHESTIANSEMAHRHYSLTTEATHIGLWDNTLLEGDYKDMSWTATGVDGVKVSGSSLQWNTLDAEHLDVVCTVENRAVERYLKNVNYTAASSTSQVSAYNVAPPARRDQPKTFVLPLSDGTQLELENLVPGEAYPIDVTDANGKHYQGQVTAEGQVRMIRANSVNNIRDLGGWTTEDGHTVRYGRLYRGGALNGVYTTATQEDIDKIKALGVGAEIDLRWKDGYDKDDQVGISAFGFGTDNYYCAQANDYLASDLEVNDTRLRLRAEFRFILQQLRDGNPVYYHCAWGADRTGLLTFLLEGLMGLSQGDIYKDYELTSFSAAGNRLFTSFKDRVEVITALSGATLQAKFNNYFKNHLCVTQSEIDAFRALMLTGLDDIDSPSVGTSSPVIYDLSGRRLSAPHRGVNIVDGKKFVKCQ